MSHVIQRIVCVRLLYPMTYAALVAAIAPFAHSQTPEINPQKIDSVVIVGNPLGGSALARPDSLLSGSELADRLRATIGETLSGLPGISSSYFGPTASRPIVRGMDGERVRVMENGAASVDASSLSPDHAVPIDPIAVSRIEILRGPAALLYGSNAIGGVVNATSNRIPTQRGAPLGAEVNMSAASGDQARAVAARLETPQAGWAFTADGSHRRTGDVSTPDFIFGGQVRTKIANSAQKTDSGAIGISRVWTGGHVGASLDRYESAYGVVASDDVTINMRRSRAMLQGAQALAGGLISEVRGHATFTRYAHDEIEGDGAVGTQFANRGAEWRLEAKSQTTGAWRWVVGTSGERSRFTAEGEEAFVPPNRTTNVAGFGLLQYKGDLTEWNAGIRIEQARVTTEEVHGADGALRFGKAHQQSDMLLSGALGFARPLNGAWTVRAGVSHTERAPTYFERYANGVHVATGAFEVGDPLLKKETAHNVELGLAWKSISHHVKFNAYHTRFRDFVSLTPTGAEFESFPIHMFRAVPARFVGAEIDSQWTLLKGESDLILSMRGDIVRADNRLTKEPLPRIAPARLGASIAWLRAGWRINADLQHTFAQRRIPIAEGDTVTAAHTIVNASLAYAFPLWGGNASVAVRGANIGNALAFNASTTQVVRDRTPLPGRTFVLTLALSY